MALYCCIFLLIFAKLYSKQTKITFNIRCFKISIGNFHLIFVVEIYIYVRWYKVIVQWLKHISRQRNHLLNNSHNDAHT